VADNESNELTQTRKAFTQVRINHFSKNLLVGPWTLICDLTIVELDLDSAKVYQLTNVYVWKLSSGQTDRHTAGECSVWATKDDLARDRWGKSVA